MHLAETQRLGSTLIDYKNSGDTAGDKSRVVGYTSIAYVDGKEMSATMKDELVSRDKEGLLRLARSAITARLVEGVQVKRPELSSPAMLEERGCFVTLHKKGQLRWLYRLHSAGFTAGGNVSRKTLEALHLGIQDFLH